MRGSRYDQQRPGGEPVVIADPPLVESTSQRFLGVPLRRTEAEIPRVRIIVVRRRARRAGGHIGVGRSNSVPS